MLRVATIVRIDSLTDNSVSPNSTVKKHSDFLKTLTDAVSSVGGQDPEFRDRMSVKGNYREFTDALLCYDDALGSVAVFVLHM